MVFDKLFERLNPNELTRQEKIAFSELANALIFASKENIQLDKKNIKRIADKINNDYLIIEHKFELRKRETIQKTHEQVMSIRNLFKETDVRVESDALDNLENITKDNDKPLLTFEDFLKGANLKGEITKENIERLVNHVLVINVNGGIVDYDAWGFTPKLSILNQENDKSGKDDVFNFFINRNCFGMTATIAAYLEKNKVDFKFGMSANHPYIILELKGKIFAISNFGMTELVGYKEKVGEFEILKVTRREKEEEKEIAVNSNLIFVCDYSDGLVYEILENFEVLRQLALGNDKTNLPGIYVKGMKLAEKYGDILKKTDWKKIQSKLFPEIYKYFIDNKKEWEEEGDRAEGEFLKYTMEVKLYNILLKAQNKTIYKNLNFKDGQSKLKEEMKPFVDEIKEFLEHSTEFSGKVPENIKTFFEIIKAEFNTIYQENNKKNPKEYIGIMIIMGSLLDNLQKNPDIENDA